MGHRGALPTVYPTFCKHDRTGKESETRAPVVMATEAPSLCVRQLPYTYLLLFFACLFQAFVAHANAKIYKTQNKDRVKFSAGHSFFYTAERAPSRGFIYIIYKQALAKEPLSTHNTIIFMQRWWYMCLFDKKNKKKRKGYDQQKQP